MNLNIDDFGGKSVVPVFCDSYISGTAFFISPTKLLTAGHILAEYILDKKATVAIIVEGDYKFCRVLYNNAVPDVAVLECIDYHTHEENVLKLLNSKYKIGIEALVVGYPRELGNGIDYFGVTVKNTREKADLKGGFDRMVIRTDSFGFNSYEGFSGSPVINDFGMVMGIQTDQLYNTLGYVSVNAIKPFIEHHIAVEIEEKEDLYDNTPYGLWTSRNHILHHTSDMLKTRYNDKVHVENDQIEKTILSFCGYGIKKESTEIFNSFKIWYNKLAGNRKLYIDSIPFINQYLQDYLITNNLTGKIKELLYENDIDKKLPSDYHKELKIVYRRMLIWNHNKELYEDKQFLLVRGAAGCGKSHLLYHLSEQMTSDLHIYMFLGSEFSSLEDPITTIVKIMKWREKEPLETLNKEMETKGKKATIIIDALNEGSGTHYWIEQLQVLKEKILRYPQLKLIVSLRNISEEDQLNNILRDEWVHLDLEGFTDRIIAIKEYFKKYNIAANETPYSKIKEFSNPLFLRIFCETYYSLSQEERNKILRLPIYKRYLSKRNIEVSHRVDEDPNQNVTSRYILWVAMRSIEQYQCEDIPRQLVFRRSRKVCPFRTWTKSLLKNCLDANLLREYTTEEGDFVDFEFDSLGDYLKADSLLNRKCDESDRLQVILRLTEVMNKSYHNNRNGNWQKQYNFIRAFLSIWNPPAMIWEKSDFIKGQLTSILLSCLPYRNVIGDDNTLTTRIIKTILQENSDYIDPRIMLQNLTIYSQELINPIHEKLLSFSMAERDLFWTTKVNDLFNGAVYIEIIESLNPIHLHDIEALLTIETWMLSSSYPELRAYMIRKVKKLLVKFPYTTISLIKKFYKVDDPYILEGLYAAVYGVIVNNKSNISRTVSEMLYTFHYGEEGRAPQDLMVRHWTLKIFELANHQDSTIDVWQKVQPPYVSTEDIFAIMSDKDYEAEGYFGDTYGGKQITRSLFHWDFSRYIIGTNSNNVSRVFFRDGEPVKLKNIEHAIAFLIKHHFGWNDNLGKYDADVPYQSRSENTMERIGKKYQWIGMYRVYAYLCDTCQMKINIWSANKGFAEHNYPWYAPNHNYFDPTLTDRDIALQISHDLFDIITPEPTIQIPSTNWLKDEQKMPKLHFIVTDRNGEEWVVLHAYSTIKEEEGVDKRVQFVFYNGFFIAKDNYKKLKRWAIKTNFYGRWMPESSGSIDYIWNEFPWANSYQILKNEDQETFNEGGINMTLAYSAQLQEDYRGIPDEEHFMTIAYSPCREMMETMSWHTAERGIIRDSEGTIMAINREIPDESLHALLVRRQQLDSYMNKKNIFLFWSLIGEKQYGTHFSDFSIARLTGAAAYISCQEIEMINPLRNESDF